MMLSVFNVFRIIFGIIISAFILIMVFRFSSSYTEIGEESRKAGSLVDLRKAIEDVYSSGIPTNFTISEGVIRFYVAPEIISSAGSMRVDVPLVIDKGEELLIYRGALDLGWWRYYFVYVLPETGVGFVPVKNKDIVWSVISNLTEVLPSTEGIEPKVFFGAGCNGTVFYTPRFEAKKFKRAIGLFKIEYDNFFDNDCRGVDTKGYFIIKVVDSDENIHARKGEVVVKPEEHGTGLIFINSSGGLKTYVYKNPLDILAMLFNGEESYSYISKDFLDKLSLAASIRKREASLLSNQPLGACASVYGEFASALSSVEAFAKRDYENIEDMKNLNRAIGESKSVYKRLEVLGCE